MSSGLQSANRGCARNQLCWNAGQGTDRKKVCVFVSGGRAEGGGGTLERRSYTRMLPSCRPAASRWECCGFHAMHCTPAPRTTVPPSSQPPSRPGVLRCWETVLRGEARG